MKLTNLIGSKAYIYGTGSFALRIKNVLNEEKITVNAFLEISKEIDTFDSLPVYQFGNFYSLDKTIPVIIGLGNPQADIASVTIKLETSGFQVLNPIQFAIYAFDSGYSFENYWLTGDISLYETNRNEIDFARTLLSDKKSKTVFDQILKYRTNGNVEYLPKTYDVSLQYLAPDLPWGNLLESELNVLDGGSFDGDTFEYFKAADLRIGSWNFIEPDKVNFERILEKYGKCDSLFNFINAALSDHPGHMNFQSTNGFGNGSKIVNTGDDLTSVFTIDSLNYIKPVNFLKLDIEGQELNALKGSVKTITNNLPVLAISIYHLPTDHWKILLWIYSLNLNYNYFIRVHGDQTFDTILYAIPALN